MATSTTPPGAAASPSSPTTQTSATPSVPPIDTSAGRSGNPPSPPPAVTLTPATPESPLATSIPDHAQPLTPPNTIRGPSGPAGEMSEKPDTPSPAAGAGAAAPTAAKPATTGPTASTARAAPAARNPPTPAGQKKKRKRSGFAAFLLALGCLSASDFEDEPGTKEKREQLAAQNEAKSAGRTVETKPAVTAPATSAAGAAAVADPTTTASTTLVGGQEVAGEPKDVVVPPVEPVILPIDETAGVTSSAVQAPGSGSDLLPAGGTPSKGIAFQTPPSDRQATTSADQTETSGGYSNISDSDMQDESGGQGDESQADYGLEDEYEDEEDRLIAQGGIGIPIDEHGNPAPLLPALDKAHQGRKCLVLDLDETLLHSSFKMLPSADYIVPVEIESQVHNVYVIKRPGVDHFLKEMGKIYEVVVFTASLSKYADPVLDMLDSSRVVRHRLFRESCYNHKGNYVKDLSQLGRSMETAIIIDNSPASYIFHPNNAVPVSTWFNDPHDTELTDLCPFLADLATVDDVRGVLDGSL